MQCWAKQLGGCAGGMTREHYFSKSLYSGNAITLKGLHWCRTDPVTISISDATANVLCQRHNGSLSDYDMEASKFQDSIAQLDRTSFQTNSRKMQSPLMRIELSGVRLSRWLTKTHCNLRAVARRAVEARFVAHSFGDLNHALRFYVHEAVNLEFNNGSVWCQDCWDDEGNVVWFVRLAGLLWIASTIELAELGDEVPVNNQWYSVQQFYERPNELKATQVTGESEPVTSRVIRISW